ncbi:MAG: glycosyltransferase family 4 protein [Deltaproteobacteria bacterium]|nr:glycosyltransferase family 4 protein [Deltaproteobacteria bacterium]
MTRIAILTPSLYAGDAIGRDVIGMYQVLTDYGHDVQMFADNWNIAEHEVKHVNKISHFLRNDSSLLIYHYSMGWNVGFDLLKETKCKKVVKYHNITPAEFFTGISTDFEKVCRFGREQLGYIARSECDLYLSDSEYNMQELISEGAEASKNLVVPPFQNIDRLSFLEADLNILNSFSDRITNILMVGRLAPNKGHVSLINAFAIYHYNYNKNSRLLIVGKKDDRLSIYTNSLHDMVARLGLEESIVFTGEVSDKVLKSYYLVSNVFMIASEHEGFCVPLVEAMAMKVPIVAYGSSAIPSTVNKAGLVWNELDPWLLAGSVNHIVNNEMVSSALSLMGWNRYQQLFQNERIENRLLEALRSFLL